MRIEEMKIRMTIPSGTELWAPLWWSPYAVIRRGGLFELHWDDGPSKVHRLVHALTEGGDPDGVKMFVSGKIQSATGAKWEFLDKPAHLKPPPEGVDAGRHFAIAFSAAFIDGEDSE